MSSPHCPHPDQLLAFTLGKLSEEAIAQIVGHLDQCPACEATVATLDQASDTLVAQLQGPPAQPEFADEPQYQQALSRVKAMATLPAAPGQATEGATLPPAVLGELGEYQLLEKLGEGGMGTVYKAIQTRLGRPVALKVLSRRWSADPQALARFDREMKAIGQLNHPNIVQAYDAREIQGTRLLVMEYVDGVDLGELVRRHGPLPIPDACELVRQAALGLQYAHEHGLVHRDIKPSNIMLTGMRGEGLETREKWSRGEEEKRRRRLPLVPFSSSPLLPFVHSASSLAPPQVKILDLGLALLKGDQPGDLAPDTPHAPLQSPIPNPQSLSSPLQSPIPNPQSPSSPPATHHPPPAEDLTATHQAMGTASYMAPEQAGDAHQVDIRADIYSLGCTLYKLLSGRPPFPRDQYRTPLDQVLAHRTKPVDPIRQLRPEIPEELAAVLDRMLAKDPADRFATPAEVAEALDPFTTTHNLADLLAPSPSHPVTPSPRHLPTRHAPPATRHPVRLALAAAGAAAAILLGVIFTVSTGKGTVKLEFADAEAARQCTISIDGDDIRIENLGEPIKLRPGKHQLRILHGDLEIETREFDVVRHGAHVLHVSLPEAYAAGGKGDPKISALQRSIVELDIACQRHPEHFGTHHALWDNCYRLGELLYARGRKAEAKAAFEKAYEHGFRFVKLTPSLGKLGPSLGTHPREVANSMSACPMAEVRNPGKALELANEAFRMEPANLNSWCTLGLAHYRACDWRESAENLEQWSKVRPPSAYYFDYFLAMAYWQLGRKDQARRCFEDLARLGEAITPDDPDRALRFRAEAAQLLGIPDVRGAEPPQPAHVYASRGRADYLKGEFSQAIAAFSEAIRLEPKVAAHYLGRGEVYAASAQQDRAITDFTEAIRLDPNDARARVNRGDVYFDQANLPKVQADFREALQISPDCMGDFFQASRGYRLLEQGNRAAVEWRKIERVLREYRQVYDTKYGFRATQSVRLDKVLGGFRERLRVSTDIDAGWLRWVSCWIPSVTQGARVRPGIVFASDVPWVSSRSAPGVAVRNGYGEAPNWIYGLPYYKGIGTQAFADERPADVVIDIGGKDFAAFKALGGGVGLGSVKFEVLLDGKRVHQTAVVRFPMLEPICVEVGAARQIVLRVLNGGEVGYPVNATWGVARFVEAGAEDPLEVPPAELQSATHANAALLLAEVHWRLDHKDLARRWFDKAAAWIDKHPADAEKLRAYRAEAAKLLGKG